MVLKIGSTINHIRSHLAQNEFGRTVISQNAKSHRIDWHPITYPPMFNIKSSTEERRSLAGTDLDHTIPDNSISLGSEGCLFVSFEGQEDIKVLVPYANGQGLITAVMGLEQDSQVTTLAMMVAKERTNFDSMLGWLKTELGQKGTIVQRVHTRGRIFGLSFEEHMIGIKNSLISSFGIAEPDFITTPECGVDQWDMVFSKKGLGTINWRSNGGFW